MKLNKKAALILSAFVLTSPLVFADANLSKEIAALELELVKMNTKVGEYADYSEAKLEKAKEKTKKTLEKKKAKAKKELDKTTKQAKKELDKTTKQAKKDFKKAGKSIKDAGKDVGDAFSNIFN